MPLNFHPAYAGPEASDPPYNNGAQLPATTPPYALPAAKSPINIAYKGSDVVVGPPDGAADFAALNSGATAIPTTRPFTINGASYYTENGIASYLNNS